MGVDGVLDPFIGRDTGVGGICIPNLFWKPLSGLPHEGVLGERWLGVGVRPSLKGWTPDELAPKFEIGVLGGLKERFELTEARECGRGGGG